MTIPRLKMFEYQWQDWDWKCVTFKTKTKTEKEWLSRPWPRLKMCDYQWQDQDWNCVIISDKTETENVWICLVNKNICFNCNPKEASKRSLTVINNDVPTASSHPWSWQIAACTKQELIKFGDECTIWLEKSLANEEDQRLVWASVKSVLDSDWFDIQMLIPSDHASPRG